MKRLWLLAFLLFSSCQNQSETFLDLTALLRFAETKADTEVLLLATSKAGDGLTSWSEPRRQSGGRFRWSTSERPALSWNLALPEPAYLHFRFAAMESFPLEIRFGSSTSTKHWIDRNRSFDKFPLPAQTTRVEFQLPPSSALGIHSAVITPSPVVAEFRKPNDFPYVKDAHFQGKKRKAIFCETGGTISFYEMLYPESELQFGYYHVPSTEQNNDTATFSILLTEEGGTERLVFRQKSSKPEFRMLRLALGNKKQSPHKLEFRIARNSVFGKGETAWIEPRLYARSILKEKSNPAIREGFRPSMAGANVLFIILDAASVRRFGAYGYGRNTTPVFDALAKEAILFERAYSNAVYTLASSASLLTGQLPGRHGVLQHRNKLPSAALTLPEALQARGLETAAFLANGNVSPAFGLTQGFETVREVFRDKNYIGRAEDITSTFQEWLGSHAQKRFFAYLHYREPHDPYQPPLQWVKKFCNAAYTGPVLRNFQERIPIETNDASYTQQDRDFISELYDANLAYGDFQVGEVLRTLKAKKLYDQTMIIVTSDHGEAFWEHGYQGHNRQLYEESARVPLLIKFPKSAGLKGKKVYFPVQHVDFFPTIMDLLGFSLRGLATTTDGSSFASWLDGSPARNREIFIHSTKRSLNAVVIDDYKFIRNMDQAGELYNLRKDSSERNNLLNAERIRAGYLRQLLLRHSEPDILRPPKTEAAELDDASRENLKALGYLD